MDGEYQSVAKSKGGSRLTQCLPCSDKESGAFFAPSRSMGQAVGWIRSCRVLVALCTSKGKREPALLACMTGMEDSQYGQYDAEGDQGLRIQNVSEGREIRKEAEK